MGVHRAGVSAGRLGGRRCQRGQQRQLQPQRGRRLRRRAIRRQPPLPGAARPAALVLLRRSVLAAEAAGRRPALRGRLVGVVSGQVGSRPSQPAGRPGPGRASLLADGAQRRQLLGVALVDGAQTSGRGGRGERAFGRAGLAHGAEVAEVHGREEGRRDDGRGRGAEARAEGVGVGPVHEGGQGDASALAGAVGAQAQLAGIADEGLAPGGTRRPPGGEAAVVRAAVVAEVGDGRPQHEAAVGSAVDAAEAAVVRVGQPVFSPPAPVLGLAATGATVAGPYPIHYELQTDAHT